jgi:glycerol-3-phosphate dehydrogenase
MGQTVLRRRDASALALRYPSDQGQPHRGAASAYQKQAYILQNEDKRIVFVIPWMDEFSIIGTTDVEYKGDPKAVAIDDKEINYLLNVYNAHFKKTLSRDDIVWTYSGVRPLCDDESDSPQAITRDYTLDIHDENGQAPLLSVFGGKLTTYRKLAEHALEKLTPITKGSARHGPKPRCSPAAISAATATTTRQNCAVASRSSVNHWPAIMPAPTGATAWIQGSQRPERSGGRFRP